jgi:hypothetical protein
LPLNPHGDGGISGDKDETTDIVQICQEDDYESMFLAHDQVDGIAAPPKATQDVVTKDSFSANSSNESGGALIVVAPHVT